MSMVRRRKEKRERERCWAKKMLALLKQKSNDKQNDRGAIQRPWEMDRSYWQDITRLFLQLNARKKTWEGKKKTSLTIKQTTSKDKGYTVFHSTEHVTNIKITFFRVRIFATATIKFYTASFSAKKNTFQSKIWKHSKPL